MSRRRVPGTRRPTALFGLPSLPDDATDDLKNALALRNACATEGRCPECRAVGEIHSDAEHAGIWHLVFAHEPWCGALTGEAA